MRILLADDHQILLQGLKGMLEKHPGYEVVGEAPNGRVAVELARDLKPDAVLMDVAMPDLNGIEATRQIKGGSPATKVIALSMHEDPLFVREMLRAGASGYLLKESAFDEVIRALNAVTSNQAFFSPAVARVVMGDFLDRGDGKPVPPEKTGTRVFDVLSAREREVLQLIAEGNSTREIAQRLFVSVKTIEGHRRLIMQKTNIKSVAELTRYAVREGITTL